MQTLAVQPEFVAQFRGYFVSLMSWPQLDAFWDVVRARSDAGWHIYTIGEEVPRAPRSADDVRKFVSEINALLHRDHDEDYCGIVYTDSKTAPTFIKIFDPHNLGVSCGSSKNPPLPGWIMSLAPPVALATSGVLPASRKRWWQQLWG